MQIIIENIQKHIEMNTKRFRKCISVEIHLESGNAFYDAM